MNSWIKTTITDKHREAMSGKKILGAYSSEVFYLPKQTERKYDTIEQYILRCFRELPPTPSAQQIASILGFLKVELILEFTQKIQTIPVVVLFYQEPTNSSQSYSVFDCQQQKLNPLLQDAVELSGLNIKYP
ncbi:hypothetical protein DSM106972_080770 [Dulcicalothrix desertica PCC 7102]|uniref:Uncharacterized protein n=1 Tax=Dulcicalothrix desertica PCC 7102 TaxID=232991 RepID=A0A433UX92_9CYAN|nr:hypothetical protein [Dulcicalothrix desertica]RUS98448.1 hypothetical protein DSM106972_080770 [Dulcicalothrix desertica PCC 7102]TWH49771.1 hypothetical protein CAL7102_04002 [Dulcicalothrix desertica PCC 7102]